MDADRILSGLLVALVIGLALLVLSQQRQLVTVADAVGRLRADLDFDSDPPPDLEEIQ